MRDRPSEAGLEQYLEGAHRHGLERDRVETTVAEATPQLGGKCAFRRRATRDHDGDWLLAQPAQRKREHTRRRRNEPLLIVDRDQDRSGLRKLTQHAEDRAWQRLGLA